jgi:putative phosphoesterase
MKIAVLSDIHANLPALDAVLAHMESISPDAVIVGGDVINRGPHPRECLERILDRIERNGWLVIKGNHEDYVIQASRGTSSIPEWERLLCAHSVWTADKIREYLPIISAWPNHLEFTVPDGSILTCFHASKKGNRVGLYEFMQDDELLEHAHSIHSALCVGHTHVPFIRIVHNKLIVNSGAVGMPFDHDHRASYALLDWSTEGWSAEIMRVPYNRMATAKAYHETGYLDEGGPMVPLILEELHHAKSMLGVWHRTYEKDVAAGTMSIEESVQAMLQQR